MNITFYIGEPEIQDYLIRFLTKSKISHCELLFSDELGFSAVPEDGTRFTFIYDHDNPDIWETIDLPWITPEDELRIRKFCEQEEDCDYDWSAVFLGRINPLHNHSSKWFCSEICAAALRPFTKGMSDFWYTPASLYDAIKSSLVFNIEIQKI